MTPNTPEYRMLKYLTGMSIAIIAPAAAFVGLFTSVGLLMFAVETSATTATFAPDPSGIILLRLILSLTAVPPFMLFTWHWSKGICHLFGIPEKTQDIRGWIRGDA